MFERALSCLRLADLSHINEKTISRQLAESLNRVCSEIKTEQNIHIYAPLWECPIQFGDSTPSQGRFEKCPDFTCIFPNPRPGSHENYEFFLHVECKVLGKNRDASYERKYVIEGINRFDSEKHRYGQYVDTGLMIGYVVGGMCHQIQQDVNCHIDKHMRHHGHLIFSRPNERIIRTNNPFERMETSPKSFTLIHIWAEIN